MYVGDRIGADRPLLLAQPPIRDGVDLCGCLGPKPARRMERRGDEGHPGDHLRLGLDITWRQERSLRITTREKEQDGGDLGEGPPIDQEGRDLTLWIEREKRRCPLLVPGERQRL